MSWSMGSFVVNNSQDLDDVADEANEIDGLDVVQVGEDDVFACLDVIQVVEDGEIDVDVHSVVARCTRRRGRCSQKSGRDSG